MAASPCWLVVAAAATAGGGPAPVALLLPPPPTSHNPVTPSAPSTRQVDIPWPYKGFESFPACWFGADPTGSPAPGTDAEPNTTMAIMARHQLVGWGWQQGMYDFPCNKLTAEACLQYAAQSFAIFTIKNQTGVRPSFVYRNL